MSAMMNGYFYRSQGTVKSSREFTKEGHRLKGLMTGLTGIICLRTIV